MSNFCTKLVFVIVFPSYYLYFLVLWLNFKMWLNEAHFGHDDPYCFDDYKRTMHHRIMKRIAQESFESSETVHVIFLNKG